MTLDTFLTWIVVPPTVTVALFCVIISALMR